VRIAFFDSGIGGLTVLKRALDVMPNEHYLYYADIRNVPYGVKPRDKVRAHIFDAAAFLARQGIDALVVACNTATSAAIVELRQAFPFPIIGMEPAVKPAIVKGRGKKVLVLATSLTLRESKLEDLIARLDASSRIERRELDRLVTFAESFEFDSPAVRDYLSARLADIDWPQYETVVLGCTHFLYYRDLIQSLTGPEVRLIDGNEGTVAHLAHTVAPLKDTATPHRRQITFYASGDKETPERQARYLALLGLADASTLSLDRQPQNMPEAARHIV